MRVLAIIAVALNLAAVQAITYEQFMDLAARVELPSSNTAGQVTFNTTDILGSVQREGGKATGTDETLSELPTIDTFSIDNAKAMEKILEVASAALHHGYYGDFFFLWSLMRRNGYNDELINNASGALADDLLFAYGYVDDSLVGVLASSATHEAIVEAYKNVLRQETRMNEDQKGIGSKKMLDMGSALTNEDYDA